MSNDAHTPDSERSPAYATVSRSLAAEEFQAACRDAGLTATSQRKLIYEVLAGSRDHPTAETLFLRVKERMPGVSLATIYRNLKRFAQAGVIEEVATGASQARYDANRASHHHLICNGCGAVADFTSEEFDTLAAPAVEIDDFEAHSLKVNVFGLCSRCKTLRESRGTTKSATKE